MCNIVCYKVYRVTLNTVQGNIHSHEICQGCFGRVEKKTKETKRLFKRHT